MKTKLLLLFALYLGFNAAAQAPGWSWAKSAPTVTSYVNQPSYNSYMTIDTDGNVIVTGTFNGQSILTFGNITLTTTAGYSGSSDIFIVKYDASGNVLWAKCVGGSGSENINSLCTDASGNILITGYFSSPTLALGNTTLTNTGAFIAKLDNSGNVLWAQSVGGNGSDNGSGISSDVNGNVFVTGSFTGTTVVVSTTTLNTPNGTLHTYIARLDASGNVIWLKSMAGHIDNNNFHIKADVSGNVFVSGQYNGNIDLGNNVVLNGGIVSGFSIFLAAFDLAGGNAVWAKSSINHHGDSCTGMSLDASGNIFITGCFTNPDSLNLGGIILTNPLSQLNNAITFVAKYDALGNALWAKCATGAGDDVAASISTDAAGNAFVTGYFSGASLAFGSTTITNANNNSYDLFIVKYDAAGNPLWSRSAGGADNDLALAICTDTAGAAYIAGYYTSTSVAFDNTTLTNTSVPTSPNNNPIAYFFIAKTSDGTFTGLKENNAETLKIYPNPFSTKLVVQADQPFNNATLMLVNSLGQTVKQFTDISTQTISISRGDLPAGIYFIHLLQDDKMSFTKKVLVTD